MFCRRDERGLGIQTDAKRVGERVMMDRGPGGARLRVKGRRERVSSKRDLKKEIEKKFLSLLNANTERSSEKKLP